MAKQLEVQMAAVLREAQDQKAAGEQAERMVKDMQQVGPISISISFLIPTAELDI